MSYFKPRKFSNNLPSKKIFDPYNIWGTDDVGFGLKKKHDRHIIKPGVTPYEESQLRKIRDYVEEKTGEKCTLPQHLIEDCYSMYVNGTVKRVPVKEGTVLKHKVLDKVYNSLTKVLTKDSPLFSQMLSKELAVYMQKIQRELEEEEKKQNGGQAPGGPGVFDDRSPEDDGSQGSGQGEGEGEGDSDGDGAGLSNGPAPSKDKSSSDISDLEDALDKILDKASNERALENSFNKAEKDMDTLKSQLSDTALKDLSTSDPNFMDTYEKLKDALKRVTISKESIKQVLAKILDESSNYFSVNYKIRQESILEAEELDDIVGLEYLHPAFKNLQLEHVTNETRDYKGKIDLYLDCSGSMGSYETFEGQRIRMIDLVKGIAMILYRMDMIDRLYFFDTKLYEIKDINEFTILAFSRSGGTDFDIVVSECIRNGRNSVVITDGYDNCSHYAKNVFWVGVGGTTFEGWSSHGSFDIFRKNGQAVTYNNGKFIYCK